MDFCILNTFLAFSHNKFLAVVAGAGSSKIGPATQRNASLIFYEDKQIADAL
jgi:hypothetical protein